MTKHEFWDRAFAAQGLDAAAVQQAALRQGAARAARQVSQVKGGRPMRARKTVFAAVTAGAVCLCALGAAAAGGLFKTPPEAAAIIAPQNLTAFAQEKNYRTLVDIYSAPDVLTVNAVQADAGYTVTLLAVASEPAAADGDLAHTHILYTVARTDGTPLTEEEWMQEIRDGVLLQGDSAENPHVNGEESTFRARDGVLYADVRVPDLYPFADRELYFAVMQYWGLAGTLGYHTGADGRISTVADYENLNILFTLPIGAEHADAAAAARVEESWQYTPTAEEQAMLDDAIEKAKARDERNAAAAAADAGRPLPEPDSAQDTVANSRGTLASVKEDLGPWAGCTRAELRAAGEVLYKKVCELTLLPGQPEPCYYYESRYSSRIFSLKELRGAPWAVVGLGLEQDAVTEVTLLEDNGDGTVTVEVLALPPLSE